MPPICLKKVQNSQASGRGDGAAGVGGREVGEVTDDCRQLGTSKGLRLIVIFLSLLM